ncbi:MAG: hypothetical protein ACK5AZ_23845 [Bryobacteraceae bacterium]
MKKARDSGAARRVAEALRRLPEIEGSGIEIRFEPKLTAHRGKLLSGAARGEPVHAASFLRERRIVLDSSLLRQPEELSRILIHEIFHFAWVRLGNLRRHSYERLLATERTRGELGWSAEWRKAALKQADVRNRTRRWREYTCESFCDSAAWLFGTAGRHPEFTLEAAGRQGRRQWFEQNVGTGPLPI